MKTFTKKAATQQIIQQALDALVLNNEEWKALADSGDAGNWKAEEQDHFVQAEIAIQKLASLLPPVKVPSK